MSAVTTNYDVAIRFLVENQNALQGLVKLQEESKKAQKEASSLSDALKKVGTAIKLYAGYQLAKKTIFAGIAEVLDTQEMERKLATTISVSQQVGLDAGRAMGKAISEGLTSEQVGIASQIIDPIAQAGGKIKDVRALAVAAERDAKALGVSAEEMTTFIQKATAGKLSDKDPLGRLFVGDIDKFNKRSPENRLKQVEKLLTSQSMKKAVGEFENSFAGSIDGFKKTWNNFLETAAGPLVQKLTETFAKFGRWVREHKEDITRWAEQIGKGIARAFEGIATVFSYIMENKETFLAVFGGLAAMKAGGSTVASLASPDGPIAKFAGGLSNATGGLLALYAAATTFAAWVDSNQENNIAAQGEQSSPIAQEMAKFLATGDVGSGSVQAMLKAAKENGLSYVQQASNQALISAKGTGLIDAKNQINLQKLAAETGLPNDISSGELKTLLMGGRGTANSDIAQFDEFKRAQELFDGLNIAVANATANVQVMGQPDWLDPWRNMLAMLTGNTQKDLNDNKPYVNVGKLVVNVASDDPDRFTMGIEGLFSDMVKNPNQAVGALGAPKGR